MGFKIGDRVKSLTNDGSGLYYGEYGRIVEFDGCGIPIVRWDEFNETRHGSDGKVEVGHGWYIFRSNVLELVEEVEDFGDLPEASTDAEDILFNL